MKLILEILHDDHVQHLAFTRFPVSVGRGFYNDVILPDPYVSARHLSLDYDGDSCVVSDLGSENGFTALGRHHNKDARLLPGDAVQIGHTEIRLFRPDHAVPPAIPLHRNSALFLWVSHPLNVALCFVLAVLVTLGWAYLEIWADDQGLALAGAVAGTIAAVILWSAAWSVAGRLTRHKAHFGSHVAFFSLYLLAGTAAWYAEAYTDFLTNEGWFSRLITYGLNFALLGILLYGSFTLATRMPRRKRTGMAAFFSFSVVAGVFLFSVVSAKNFSQQPIFASTLEPYLSQFAAAKNVDAFMTDSAKLFSSDEFAQVPAPATPVAKAK